MPNRVVVTGERETKAGAMDPLTLAFYDRDLERTYVAHRAARYLSRSTTVGFVVTAMTWIAMSVWASTSLRGAESLPIVRVVWLANVPILLCAAAIVQFVARDRLLPWVPTLSSSTTFVGIAIVVAHALLRDAFDPYAAPMLAIYLLCVHTFMALRFITASIVSLALALLEIFVIVIFVPRPAATIVTSAFFLTAGLIFGMLLSRRDERYRRREFHQKRLLADERARSERLLANMLPEAIAARLKQDELVIAEAHDDVTVLFADIVGFTVLSGTVRPTELVELLNRVFTAFDELADRLGLEKIKTIGDAYMVVGGLPKPRADNTTAVVEMGLAMREALATIRSDLQLSLRIGIHVGPVVAGVIGKRKYSYDLWGDTVNTASRMESHGASGRIHVSEGVRAAIGDSYAIEPRGTVEIKGKGSMNTYWVDRRSR
jgi:class 3 adenylate cyclase